LTKTKFIFYVCFSVSVFLLSSCATGRYYSQLRTSIEKEDYAQALTLAENSQSKYGDKNLFLYYIDTGMLAHLNGSYEESNSYFEKAKQLYSENYTKSVSAGLFSLFTNDNAVPYYGLPYEAAYVNVFCALNYVMQGKNNEAVVEARQADNLFKKLQADSQGKAFYQDDGFVRYFMGLVYENAGYINDALISYKLALKTYPKSISKTNVPRDLINSLYNSYLALSMTSEAQSLKQEYPFVEKNNLKNKGELIIINYNGIAPEKTDYFLQMSFDRAWFYYKNAEIIDEDKEQADRIAAATIAGFSKDVIKFSFPKFVRIPNSIVSFSIKGSNEKSFTAQDMATMMENYLSHYNTTIYARTIARAVGRYLIAKQITNNVEKNSGEQTGTIVNALFNVANSLIEKADTRSWHSIPENINILRTEMSPGEHEITVNFYDKNSNIIKTKNIKVQVAENKKTFIAVSSIEK